MENSSEIERVTSQLVGKSLWGWGRATNMAMFDFGTPQTIIDRRGREKQVGEFVIHVHCHWRIATEDRVLVGSRDINYPAEYSDSDKIPDEFDWDRDVTRLDRLAAALFQNDARKFVVREVKVGRAGSLYIAISGESYLDIFPDDSLTSEHWRLFAPGKEAPHLVVTGKAEGAEASTS